MATKKMLLMMLTVTRLIPIPITKIMTITTMMRMRIMKRRRRI